MRLARLPVALPFVLLLAAAPAARAELTAPEVYVRDLDSAGSPAGDWQPLAGAKLRSVYGEQLGAKLQATDDPGNEQRFLPAVTSVPDGHPDQPDVDSSLCFRKSGDAGTIVPLDGHVRYEGDGAYGAKVTVTTGSDAGTGCDLGPSTSGTFTSATPATIEAVGVPLLNPTFRHGPFAGVEVGAPLGASVEDVLCARDPVRKPDGSLRGSAVRSVERPPSQRVDDHSLYARSGYWSCVARGRHQHAGPWSAPTPRTLVREDYYGVVHPRLTDRLGPRYRLEALTQKAAVGGRVTLEARVVKGCTKKGDIVTRKSGKRSARATVGANAAVAFRLKLPGPPASSSRPVTYLASSTLSGARFVKTEHVDQLGIRISRSGATTRAKLLTGIC
jgi:hypothetical protein